MKISKFNFDNQQVNDILPNIIFDPGFPNIYVPYQFWKDLAPKIESSIKKLLISAGRPYVPDICKIPQSKDDDGYCRLERKCDDIK